MKKYLFLSLWLCSGAANAAIINGSFETGDYSGWTLLEDSSDPSFGTWGIASNGQFINNGDSTFDYFDGVLVQQNSPGLPMTYSSTDGGFVAYQLQNGPENHRMYQDVSLDVTATTLDWDMMYSSHSGFSSDQFLSVHIRNTSDVILETLFTTSIGDPFSILAMTSFSSNISAYAGTTIRLDIEMNVQDNFFDAAFDDFRVDGNVSTVPAPAAVWLLSSGLIGLIGMRKKSSKVSTLLA